MKKIVWLIHWPNDIYLNIANELSKSTDLVLIMDKRYVKNIKENPKIKYISLNTISNAELIKKFKNKDYPVMAYYKHLKTTLKNEKPDVVISNLCYFPGTWQASNYCKKHNIPFILQTEMQRYPESKILKFATKILIKRASKTLLKNSKYILPWTEQGVIFAKNNFHTNIEKIKPITAGIDDKIFYKKKNEKRNETPKNEKLKILYVARFFKYKRHEDLIKMLEYLRSIKKNKNIELNFLGEGPIKEDIKERIKESKLENQINFLERTPTEKMKELYSKNDLLVLPSYNEAIGMVVPEAMICGLPTIVSDTAGARMYVKNNETGYIFKTGDYKELAEKVLLLKNKKRRISFGKNAENHIKKNYTIKVVTEKFKKYLNA
jgi:glycosyltransferase involved in cell wall biosynthesis